MMTVKSLFKRKFKNLLIFSLLCISFYLMIQTYINSNTYKYHLSEVTNILGNNMNSLYVVNVTNISDEKDIGKNINFLKEEISSMEGVDFIGAYDYSGVIFNDINKKTELLQYNLNKYKGTRRQNAPEVMEVLFVDPSLLNLIGINSLDMNNKNNQYPIYVGENYKDYFDLDDKLYLNYNDTNYIVKGYIKEKKWISDSDILTLPTNSLEDFLILPFSENDQQDNTTQLSTIGKIIIKIDPEDEIIIKQKISNVIKDINFKVRVDNLKTSMNSFVKNNQKYINSNLLISIVVFFCTIIAVISVLSITAILRSKEIGIKKAYGYSNIKIFIGFFLENFIIIFLSAMLSVYLNYRVYLNSIDMFATLKINFLYSKMLVFLIFIIILSVLVAWIPMIVLKEKKPRELLEGSF